MNSIFCTVLISITLIDAPVVHAGEPAYEKCIQVYTTAKDTKLRMTLSDHLQLKPAQHGSSGISEFVHIYRQETRS